MPGAILGACPKAANGRFYFILFPHPLNNHHQRQTAFGFGQMVSNTSEAKQLFQVLHPPCIYCWSQGYVDLICLQGWQAGSPVVTTPTFRNIRHYPVSKRNQTTFYSTPPSLMQTKKTKSNPTHQQSLHLKTKET